MRTQGQGKETIPNKGKSRWALANELGRSKKAELSLAVDVTVPQSPGRYTMHPTIRVKRKLNAGEMANNQLKRQEAPSGIFLLTTLHPMSQVPPLHHSRGLHTGSRGMLGWGQEGYRYCPNSRTVQFCRQDFQSLIYLQSDHSYLVIAPSLPNTFHRGAA